MSAAPPEALKRFIWDIQSMVELADDPREILLIGGDILGRLLAQRDWLPEAFVPVGAETPKTCQIYADGMERFSIQATVLAPGQATPPAAEPFWRLLGVVEGTVIQTAFAPDGAGRLVQPGVEQPLGAGARRGAKAGGVFALANRDLDHRAIILSAHGGEIGKVERRLYDSCGEPHVGVTGYDNGPEAPPFDIFTIQTRIED